MSISSAVSYTFLFFSLIEAVDVDQLISPDLNSIKLLYYYTQLKIGLGKKDLETNI